MCKSSPPAPVIVTLAEQGLGPCHEVQVFLDWILNPVTGVLTQREEDTKERGPCENRGRDWGDVATTQGYLEPSEREEERNGFPLEPLEGLQPCWHLEFRLLASRE